MREAFLHHVYSGDAVLSASAIIFVLALCDATGVVKPRFVRSAARVALLLAGIILLSLAAPQFIALLIGAAALLIVHLGFAFAEEPRRLHRRVAAGAMIAALTLAGSELPFRGSPSLPRAQRIVVIGDSLSSGGFGERQTWPAALGSQVRADVVNLSLPSETAVSAAASQLPLLPPAREGDVLIIAVGGNDMLDRTGVRAFAASLTEIIAKARRRGYRDIALLEFPFLPTASRYGIEQRRIGHDNDAKLIPKRLLAATLLDRRNTFDGIHLTTRGHEELAARLRTFFAR